MSILSNEGYVKVPDDSREPPRKKVRSFFRDLNASPDPNLVATNLQRSIDARERLAIQNQGYVATEGQGNQRGIGRLLRNLNSAPDPQQGEQSVAGTVGAYGRKRVREELANAGAGMIDTLINDLFGAPEPLPPREGPGLLSRAAKAGGKLLWKGTKALGRVAWKAATTKRSRPEKPRSTTFREEKTPPVVVRRVGLPGPVPLPRSRQLTGGRDSSASQTRPGSTPPPIVIDAKFKK